MNEMRLEEAKAMFAELEASDPELHGTNEIQDLQRRFVKMDEEERFREAQFTEVIALVEEKGPIAITPRLIQQVEGLARSYDERLKVQQLKVVMGQYEKEKELARDKRIEALIKQLQDRLAEAKSAYKYSSDSVVSKCERCVELSMKIRDISDLKADEKAQVTVALQEALSLREQWNDDKERHLRIQRRLDGLAASLESLDDLRNGFVDFIAEFQDHPLRDDFVESGQNFAAWEQLQLWRSIRQRWVSCRVDSCGGAEQRIEDLKPVLQSDLTSWLLPKMTDYSAYLQCAKGMPPKDECLFAIYCGSRSLTGVV